jgi:predicted dehydrogenase
MKRKVKWGVLGVANIAVRKVIPAMKRGDWCEVTAIASRDLSKAQQAAAELGLPKAYGSYEELLRDPEIEAIYNPLPNHLHVEWTIKAAAAGKHVLCEKPISLSAEEALPLLEVRNRTGVRIEEAFMVRTNPQWIKTLEMIEAGRIGQVRSVMGFFSYNNRDPQNIRNIRQAGGGGLMDIGCYLVYFSRLIFANEPARVVSLIEENDETHTDVLTSALLEFPSGHAVMTCSTRITPYQRVQIVGTLGRIEVEIPVNAPPDQILRILVDDGSDLFGRGIEVLEFSPCNQYTVQGDFFSRSIRENTPPPVSLEDSIRNMAVVDAIFLSSRSGKWEAPATWN